MRSTPLPLGGWPERSPLFDGETLRTAPCIIAAIVFGLVASGCEQRAVELAVRRPAVLVDRPVIDFQMESDWASWSGRDDGGCDVLLLLPLPGSQAGRAIYAVFLHLPTTDGVQPVSLPDQGGGHAIFAHLSRSVGQFNAACHAEQGTVQLGRDKAGRLTGTFELVCPDQTRLTGRFTAAEDKHMVSGFQREYLARPDNQKRLAAGMNSGLTDIEPDLLAPLFVPQTQPDIRPGLEVITPLERP